MLEKIIRTIYFAFISIVLISIILASWTSYTFVFQSSKSNEITHVIKDIYANQKSIVIDIIDLSKILIKDTSEPQSTENNNLQKEEEFLGDVEDNPQLDKSIVPEDNGDNPQMDKSLVPEDNGDNPLGIVIEPSELIQEPLLKEEKEFSMNGMDMDY